MPRLAPVMTTFLRLAMGISSTVKTFIQTEKGRPQEPRFSTWSMQLSDTQLRNWLPPNKKDRYYG
jgi:hypothetical protein